jgi:hypothetical protein
MQDTLQESGYVASRTEHFCKVMYLLLSLEIVELHNTPIDPRLTPSELRKFTLSDAKPPSSYATSPLSHATPHRA